MNNVNLLGNLTRDVEVRSTKSGRNVASFTIAVSDTYVNNNTQEVKERTAFINCVAWGKQAEQCEGMTKGAKLFVNGRLNTRSYEAQDGTKKYITEVVCNFVAGQERQQATQQTSNFDNFGGNAEEFPF